MFSVIINNLMLKFIHIKKFKQVSVSFQRSKQDRISYFYTEHHKSLIWHFPAKIYIPIKHRKRKTKTVSIPYTICLIYISEGRRKEKSKLSREKINISTRHTNTSQRDKHAKVDFLCKSWKNIRQKICKQQESWFCFSTYMNKWMFVQKICHSPYFRVTHNWWTVHEWIEKNTQKNLLFLLLGILFTCRFYFAWTP